MENKYTDDEMDTMRSECAEHYAEALWDTGEIWDALYYGVKGYKYMPENEVIDYFVDNWNDTDFTVPLRKVNPLAIKEVDDGDDD